MGVDHVELMVMLFVASVKHLYQSLSQLFLNIVNTSHTPQS